jgi:hypothetical protein
MDIEVTAIASLTLSVELLLFWVNGVRIFDICRILFIIFFIASRLLISILILPLRCLIVKVPFILFLIHSHGICVFFFTGQFFL